MEKVRCSDAAYTIAEIEFALLLKESGMRETGRENQLAQKEAGYNARQGKKMDSRGDKNRYNGEPMEPERLEVRWGIYEYVSSNCPRITFPRPPEFTKLLHLSGEFLKLRNSCLRNPRNRRGCEYFRPAEWNFSGLRNNPVLYQLRL